MKDIDSDSDSDLELSAHAQAALAAFLSERQATEQVEEAALAQVESVDQVRKFKNNNKLKNPKKPIKLKEDWQLSQFWNDEATCSAFATIIKGELERRNISSTGRCVFISSPTPFKYMMTKKILSSFVCYFYTFLITIKFIYLADQMHLLEFDKRFAAYGDNFNFWDFNDPLALPEGLKGTFDLVLMDPPFLNEDTFEKTFKAVDWLRKDGAAIMISSGAMMRDYVKAYSSNIDVMEFIPRHQNNLSNQWSLQCNFNADAYLK